MREGEAYTYRQPYHMHDTFAFKNIAAGEDLNWVKDMFGHETLEMLLLKCPYFSRHSWCLTF